MGKIRAKLSLSYNGYKIERTVQRDGSIYTQNTAKIGSKSEGIIEGSVAASNRQTQETQQLESNAITPSKERDAAGGGLPPRTRVVVTDSHPLFAGQHGVITGRPTVDAAIVALDEGAREHILVGQLQPEPIKPVIPVSKPKLNIQPSSDVLPSEPPPTNDSSVNKAVSAHGKPDVVAVEIAIGARHLTPEQLAWSIISAASNGLSDSHLKAVIKAAKQALNQRHHPEYFADKN